MPEPEQAAGQSAERPTGDAGQANQAVNKRPDGNASPPPSDQSAQTAAKDSNAAVSQASPEAKPQTRDMVYAEHIRSVRLHPIEAPLEAPIVRLGSGEQLELRFDDLSEQVRPYRMALYHCDRNWERSDLDFNDYLKGFDRVNLNAFTFSTLGKTRFVQYTYRFPNAECQPLLSGNYLLLVYDEDQPKRAVLTRRFYVTERQVGIEAKVQRPASPKYRNSHQQLRIEVQTQDLESSNPMAQLGLTVLQNLRPDNGMVDLKPDFLREGQLSYQSPDLVFPAGKEWRFGSLRSTRLLTEGVQRIDRQSTPPTIFMRHDAVRSFRQYRFRADMNGRWFVAADDNGANTGPEQDEREAEYLKVHFFLPYPAPLNDGHMHLFGGFDDFRLDESTRMAYNLDRGGYEAVRLLKQGVYNWQYAFVPFASGENNSPGGGTPQADLSVVEGDWYETENRYDAFMYLRDFRLRCDRLVGHTSVRSIN